MSPEFGFEDIGISLSGLPDGLCSFVTGGRLDVYRLRQGEMVLFFPCAKGEENKQWGT
jgi:hypothetical protein